MCSTKIVQFRLSEKQHKLLLNRMEAAGFRTVSSYIRAVALTDDLTVLGLVKDIHKKVVGVENE